MHSSLASVRGKTVSLYLFLVWWVDGGWGGGEYREGTENASVLTTPVKSEKFKWTV